MTTDRSTRDHLHFLIHEVARQVRDTGEALEDPAQNGLRQAHLRENQIDNLKRILHEETFERVRLVPQMRKSDADRLQAIHVIATNLENIADYCINILHQIDYLTDPGFIERFPFLSFVRRVDDALERIESSLYGRDVEGAVRICESEAEIDQLYAENFTWIMDRLKTGQDVENLVTSLYILRYFERMGDALLNVGEAIISAAVGERLKLHQFQALETTVEQDLDSSPQTSLPLLNGPDFMFETIAETRSGSRIGRVRPEDGDARWAVFKEGDTQKLLEEKAGLECWQAVEPSLAPQVFAFRREDGKSAIVLEFIEGQTLQRSILDRSMDEVAEAVQAMTTSLAHVWERTKAPQPINADYAGQLDRRLDAVLELHPETDLPSVQISGLTVPSFRERLAELRGIEADLDAPFRVLIHGDFNTDNILYQSETERLTFIDLHRSRPMDYAQDVSVFLVSNFRMPVFEPNARRRLNAVVTTFYRFARDFARDHDDPTFEARLALGLVRSWITSTRFVLMKPFAHEMALRAVYLMDRLRAHRGQPWADFHLPPSLLTYRPDASLQDETLDDPVTAL